MPKKQRAKRAGFRKDRSTPSGSNKGVKPTKNKKTGGKTKHVVVWKPTTVLMNTLAKNLTDK